MERIVKTGVQHVRGGRREPKCGMSAHGVSGALEAGGGEVSGLFWVVAEMDGREFGVPRRFVCFCHSG